jgi:hypothetical protein
LLKRDKIVKSRWKKINGLIGCVKIVYFVAEDRYENIIIPNENTDLREPHQGGSRCKTSQLDIVLHSVEEPEP